MKKIFLSSVALVVLTGATLAADLPSRKEPVAATPKLPTWTGFHLGINAGGTFGISSVPNSTTWNIYQPAGNAELTSAALLSGSGSNSGNGGFIGGGQIGYDWLLVFGGMAFVSGVEADIQGIAGSGSSANRWAGANTESFDYPYSLLSNQQGRGSLQYFGTVRGRLGYLITHELLLYGTGGLAYGGVSANLANSQLYNDLTGGDYNYFIAGKGSYSNTQVGWTAGGGAEWMFMQNWSTRVEYLYYNLGSISGAILNNFWGTGAASGDNGIQSFTNYSGRVRGNIVRAGVNYHFNFGAEPIFAKF